jgi:hypothetical protein
MSPEICLAYCEQKAHPDNTAKQSSVNAPPPSYCKLQIAIWRLRSGKGQHFPGIQQLEVSKGEWDF